MTMFVAEIMQTPATWHIARVAPGREKTAAWHFQHRRFGVYLPLVDVWDRNAVVRQPPLFPGYLLLWLWGLAHHVERVKAIPGVLGFLLDGEGRPVTVPDAVIRDIEAIEWKAWLSNLPRSFYRRRRRHEQWVIPHWGLRNYGFADPQPERRVDALHRALGLSPTLVH